MLPVVLLALVLPTWSSPPLIAGVQPSLLERYSPVKSKTPTKWKCLDNEQEILYSAVNDDYCDCSDGSDEPGTGACPNSTFYCWNEGHIGAVIPSSRVRDGLCEPECCDGSDEPSGVCANKCKEIGEEYAKKQAAENKVRKTGAKIRSTYISHAQKEKNRLQKVIASLDADIIIKEKEVAKLKDIKEHSEKLSAAEVELKKQSQLYQSLQIHMNALKSFRRIYNKLKKRDETLRDILNALREGYNPNYQDMAVLEAVRGWEAMEGLPPKGSDEDASTDPAKEEALESQEELEPGAWTEGQLEHQLDGLIEQDYLALLLSYESYLEAVDKPSILMDITSYLPDTWMPYYAFLRNQIIAVLRSIGLIHGGGHEASEEAATAMKAFNDANDALKNIISHREDSERKLHDLFDPEHFGKDGEWKKLEGLCLEKEYGDYTYEVCLFESATQKAKTGGSHSLGSFKSWNIDAPVGEHNYYTKQRYRNGAQCWNGPQRSVTLELKCGTENALHTVSEPEKCEYHITGESPALCLPLEIGGSAKSDL